MAVTSKVYGPAFISLFAGQINFTGATARAMLCTSTYVPNQDTHRFKSDVTGEVTGTGYTARGVALTTKTASFNTSTNVLTLSCDSPAWATSTITARYLVFYMDTGTDSTSPLLTYVDFGANQSSSANTFSYVVPSTGIAQFTVA